MMRYLTAVLLWTLAGVCVADPMFEPEDEARRVELVTYSPDKVVKVGAIVDHPFLIEFAGDEQLEEVAGGAVGGWEVHKKGRRLFILARKDSKYTTLLVTTSKRSYVFDLVPKRSTPNNFERRRSKIVFTYPVAAPLPTPVPPPGPRNHNYAMQVVALQADIRPSEVYDDGRFTWLKFPGSMEVPVIYKSEPGTREEMLVNHHVEGEYIVMHAIAPLWNLRLAGSMIGVFNDSYERRGSTNQSGTTVPGLVRESKP